VTFQTFKIFLVQTATIILLLNAPISFAFVCNLKSTAINADIDFERLASYQWYIAGKVEGKTDIERPFGFPLHKLTTVNTVLSKPKIANRTTEVFGMEFNCGKFYAVMTVSDSMI
jgi:hypothetical protein